MQTKVVFLWFGECINGSRLGFGNWLADKFLIVIFRSPYFQVSTTTVLRNSQKVIFVAENTIDSRASKLYHSRLDCDSNLQTDKTQSSRARIRPNQVELE